MMASYPTYEPPAEFALRRKFTQLAQKRLLECHEEMKRIEVRRYALMHLVTSYKSSARAAAQDAEDLLKEIRKLGAKFDEVLEERTKRLGMEYRPMLGRSKDVKL